MKVVAGERKGLQEDDMHGKFVGFEVGRDCDAGQERGQEGEIDSTCLVGSREMMKKEQMLQSFSRLKIISWNLRGFLFDSEYEKLGILSYV